MRPLFLDNTNLRFGKYLSPILTFGDWIILNLSAILTYILINPSCDLNALHLILIINFSYIPIVISRYRVHNLRMIGYDKIIAFAVYDVVKVSVIALAMLYIFKIEAPRTVYFSFILIFILLLTLWGLTIQVILRQARKMGYNFSKAIIIGAGRTAKQLLKQINSNPGYGINVVAVFDDNPSTHNQITELYNDPIFEMDKVRDIAINQDIKIVYYALDGNDKDSLVGMMQVSEEVGAEFIYIPKLPQLISAQFKHIEIGSMHGLVHKFSPLTRFGNKLVKRLFDIIVSGFFAILSPIIFIPIAIGIKMSSPGPVFFRQKRTGLHGKEFTCLKFRTMKVNSISDSKQATKDDPRKTKFGDFLRRTSLDELPQFYNVLIGNMTVVGPRPHMVSHTEKYRKLIDKYMVRHAIKPGITGWAQVNGYRGATEKLWQMEKRVEHDVWYISNWSIFLDIKIVFLTVFNQLKGEDNAY